MAIFNEISSVSLVLLVSIVLVLLAQVQSKTSEPTNGQYAPDAAAASRYMDSIYNALESDQASSEFNRLSLEWGARIDGSQRGEIMDPEEKQQLRVALSYLLFHHTKQLLDMGDIAGAISMLESLKSMRRTWQGVQRRNIDRLEREVEKHIWTRISLDVTNIILAQHLSTKTIWSEFHGVRNKPFDFVQSFTCSFKVSLY